MFGDDVVFRVHALQRMAERDISVEWVQTALRGGSTIEDYPNDFPYPSRLILDNSGNRPLHVVAAYDVGGDKTILITAYIPDSGKWSPDFRSRR